MTEIKSSSGSSEKTVKRLEALLEKENSIEEREQELYYGKVIVIPKPGDIVRLQNVFTYNYLLITEVYLGTREEMFYRGYALKVVEKSGVPKSRKDVELETPLSRRIFYPKKRRDVFVTVEL